jgi:L-ascorbate metabolism protein UlaG (beta-lactamase superfamily)
MCATATSLTAPSLSLKKQVVKVKTSSPEAKARRPRRRLRRFLGWVAVLVALAAAAGIASGWRAYGKRPDGARLARMQQSPQWKDGRFENAEPMHNHLLRAAIAVVNASRFNGPNAPVPVQHVDPKRFAALPASGLRITWLGHSTFFVEIDGARVLVDPHFSQRSSPITWAGPKRWYGPLIAIGDLPAPDAVVISHDHYDHLDYATIVAMKDWKTTFVVPLGVGAHLEYWGVPANRIVELDWWEKARVRALDIVATPARHISGRTFGIGDSGTLWSGFAFIGGTHRAYYSGDTGLFRGIREIGDRLGPFDVTLIEAGEYGRWWSDWHLGPEQAVRAHQLVRGKVFIPAHWGLFTLAYHAWTEPADRVLTAAARANVTAFVPMPGQSIEPLALPAQSRWWPTLPGRNADEDPIVSTNTEQLYQLTE